MNITTKIIDIAHGLDENGDLGVLNFAVLAEAESGESARLEISQLGGSYPPPATPRTPVMEPVMEMQPGEDGELHEVVNGQKVVGYTGGYTAEELNAIASKVAEADGAHDIARSRLEAVLIVPLAYVPPPAHVPDEDEQKAMLAAQIDGKVAYIYRQFTQFQVEYELREAAAQAYKNAGYTGQADPLIADYAESSGMTAEQAAEATLYMASQLRAALPQLGVLRMRKNRVLRASSMEDARAEFGQIMGAIEQIESALP